jgi:hypothetical protein
MLNPVQVPCLIHFPFEHDARTVKPHGKAPLKQFGSRKIFRIRMLYGKRIRKLHGNRAKAVDA